jgi:hypothetical protein
MPSYEKNFSRKLRSDYLAEINTELTERARECVVDSPGTQWKLQCRADEKDIVTKCGLHQHLGETFLRVVRFLSVSVTAVALHLLRQRHSQKKEKRSIGTFKKKRRSFENQ